MAHVGCEVLLLERQNTNNSAPVNQRRVLYRRNRQKVRPPLHVKGQQGKCVPPTGLAVRSCCIRPETDGDSSDEGQ